MRTRTPIFFPLVLVALTAFNTACSSKVRRSNNPTAISSTVDVAKLAAKAFDQFKAKTPLDEARRANAFIVCVAEQVIHDMRGDWEIAIFRKNTPSLFVLPGRKIGVYSGTLRIVRNQHQLASILAHGMAHVIAHHPDKRVAQQGGAHPEVDFMKAAERPWSAEGRDVLKILGMEAEGGVVMPFDHAQETAANVLGLELMARAGFNPGESLLVWRSVDSAAASRSSGLAAIHPSYGNRSAELDNHMEAALKLQQQALVSRKKPECDRLR